MRVRTVRSIVKTGPRLGQALPLDPSLQHPPIGSEHVVLAVQAETLQREGWPALMFFLEVSPPSTPGWFPASMFEVSSAQVPANWQAALSGEGLLTLAPAAWLADDDLWKFLAGEGVAEPRRAHELFERERALADC